MVSCQWQVQKGKQNYYTCNITLVHQIEIMKNKAQMLLYSCVFFYLAESSTIVCQFTIVEIFEITNFFSLTGTCLKEELILAFGMVILL